MRFQSPSAGKTYHLCRVRVSPIRYGFFTCCATFRGDLQNARRYALKAVLKELLHKLRVRNYIVFDSMKSTMVWCW